MKILLRYDITTYDEFLLNRVQAARTCLVICWALLMVKKHNCFYLDKRGNNEPSDKGVEVICKDGSSQIWGGGGGGGAGHLDQIHEDLCNNAVTIFESIGRQKTVCGMKTVYGMKFKAKMFEELRFSVTS